MCFLCQSSGPCSSPALPRVFRQWDAAPGLLAPQPAVLYERRGCGLCDRGCGTGGRTWLETTATGTTACIQYLLLLFLLMYACIVYRSDPVTWLICFFRQEIRMWGHLNGHIVPSLLLMFVWFVCLLWQSWSYLPRFGGMAGHHWSTSVTMATALKNNGLGQFVYLDVSWVFIISVFCNWDLELQTVNAPPQMFYHIFRI